MSKLKVLSITISLICILCPGHALSKESSKVSLKKDNESKETLTRNRRDTTPPIPTNNSTDEENIDDPNRPDPFPLSIEWANFVKRMDEISILVKTRAEHFTTILTDKNPEFAANKTSYLGNFVKNFSKDFKQLSEIFEPLQEQLDLNKAYTIVDPAVDLETLEACHDLAKSNPTKEMDKGRLKWIEVNAMAATIHHIFDRLTPGFEEFGLEEVSDKLEIHYPSWTAVSIVNETGDTYIDMIPQALIDYIGTEIDSLGPNYHLIRVLEKLLQKKYGLAGWNPSKTNLNKYCYGNNKYGLIHKKFDVLIDAAEYLVMANMKYALIQMTHLVYKTYKIEMGESQNETKPDLTAKLEEIHKNMTAHIDKIIKFSKLADIPADVSISSGPTVFRCDPAPVDCDSQAKPKITAKNCPHGVYVQDWIPYSNGKALTVPENVNDPIKNEDGSVIECLAVEYMAFNATGSVVPCEIKDKKCIDDRGNPTTESLTVKAVPILVDPARVPHHRDNLIETYVEGGQWGIFDCTTHFPHPLDPPQGPLKNDTVPLESPPGLNCTIGQNDKGPGYIDCRNPGLNASNTAEFSLAFPGYLESELVLSPEGKCIGTCQEYKEATPTCTNKTTHCDLYRDSHCEKRGAECMKSSKCPNKAKRCIRTSREVTFCPAQPGMGRVYDWYTVNGQIHRSSGLGGPSNATVSSENPTCNGNPALKIKERWEMESGVILNAPQYCELCLCVCSDHIVPEGQHFFDTEALNADTANGFVVSGLRFEQKNKTMFLNIQQGKILPNGKIDPSTLKWFDTTASGHTPKLVELGANGFHKMNLDVIEPATPGEVVTGVSWKVEENSLVLSVGFSTFDTVKGTLSTGPPTYREAKYPPPQKTRQKYNIEDPITPVKQTGPSQPYPITDNSKYIEFDASSLEKDGGQAVIPFFDLQPLTDEFNYSYRPLRNVGILYKSKAGSGGFITVSTKF